MDSDLYKIESVLNQSRKDFQSQKHDVKPPAVFQSDEEGDTDFEMIQTM